MNRSITPALSLGLSLETISEQIHLIVKRELSIPSCGIEPFCEGQNVLRFSLADLIFGPALFQQLTGSYLREEIVFNQGHLSFIEETEKNTLRFVAE